ncbi:MAG: Lipoprotein LpqB, beta-propeller domain-like protein [Pseudonocardiales bacterium]|nr:Lipoprotein LpqB, beta-propeller domain-like protein [Pseudonocardiales bacterium]
MMHPSCVTRGARATGRPWATAILVMFGLLISGCSGVPSSSLPQVVRTIDGTGVASATPTVRPEENDDTRATVTKFLRAQVTNDELHQAAKAFLTDQAATKWQDSTVTVVNNYRVGYPDANNLVTVTGQVVGTLDSNGLYTPTLSGSGLLPDKNFQFTLVRSGAQWRISDPPGGLLVEQKDFLTSFHRRLVYFFDQSEKHLVPDLRYSPLDGQSLATWMLEQLIAGPQQEQSNALRDEFPDGVDPQRAKVTLSKPINVQLPGLSQSDVATQHRVAAEISYAFDPFAPGVGISLYDGATRISVGSGAAQFTAADFPQFSPTPASVASLYFLRNGAVVSGATTPAGTSAAVAGKGATQYPLVSVAVAGQPGQEELAGLTAPGNILYVGSSAAGLRAVPLDRAASSRPEWVLAATDEVWLGLGPDLVRVSVGVSTQETQKVQLGSIGTDLSKLSVRSVRVSPEGARVALVLVDPDGSGSVWVGSVARSGDTVQVEGLRQITPSDWQVRDVAWAAGGIALRAVGSEKNGPQIEIWQLNCDGSAPSEASSDNLPALPDWITATVDGSTWVSVSDRIFSEQPLGGWVNPLTADTGKLSAPIYGVVKIT